jgi:putative Ca2+/H+ antiporter (TMEM165/GDT1 family)
VEAFLVSTLIVAIGEMGDKTQLLALVLAARYRRAVPIIMGILVATLANHALAGIAGEWVRGAMSPETLRGILGASFIAIGAWTLVPDEMDSQPDAATRRNVILVTLSAFFVAEMGDKTQLATVALAAQYHALAAVVAGTTLGMLLANIPIVCIANKAAPRLPMKAIRIAAAVLFLGLGVAVLVR